MIGVLGSSVTVTVYQNHDDRIADRDGRLVQAQIVSAGPPGVVADWGISEDQCWLLVRKPMHMRNRWEAVANDGPSS